MERSKNEFFELEASLHKIKARVEMPEEFERTQTSSTFAASGSTSTSATSQVSSPIVHLLAGSMAGGVAKTCVAPFDRLKILIQVSDKPTFSLGEGARLLKTTMASEGILGLWRGNSATLLRVLPYAGLHFMTHEALEQHFRNHQEGQRLSPVNRFAAGAGAGAISTLATYPLDVIRARMAVTATAVTPTITETIRQLVSGGRGSMRPFFQGLTPTLLGIVPYSGTTWLCYETLKDYTDLFPGGGSSSTTNKVLCGMVAGLVGQSVTYPLDVIRRRMQVNREGTMLVVIKRSFRLGGTRTLFKGLSLSWFKGPLATMSLNTFELLKELYSRWSAS